MKNILIVGGGIAGITAAYFLQNDHKVTLIEKAKNWRTIGYAVGVWANGLHILKKMPLQKSFWNSAKKIDEGNWYNAQGKRINRLSFDKITKNAAVTIPREHIHQSIRKLLTKVNIQFSTTVTEIIDSKTKTAVTFSSGTQHVFDLVIAADGMRSQTRNMCFQIKERDYGWNLIGAWSCSSRFPEKSYSILAGANEFILSISYNDKQAIGIGYRSNTKPQTIAIDQIKHLIPNIQNQISHILKTIDKTRIFHDRLSYVQTPFWYKNRVVIIGDAKHGLSPLNGFGTSLALEDAYELAKCLNDSNSISTALKTFASNRNQTLGKVKTYTKLLEPLAMTNGRVSRTINDAILASLPTKVPIFLIKRIITKKR